MSETKRDQQARILQGEHKRYLVIHKDSQAPVLLLEWIAEFTMSQGYAATIQGILEDVTTDEMFIDLQSNLVTDLEEARDYINNNLPVS